MGTSLYSVEFFRFQVIVKPGVVNKLALVRGINFGDGGALGATGQVSIMSPNERESVRNGSSCRSASLPPEDVMFGRSAALVSVLKKVKKVAGSDVPVLLEGERGTGKELLARWIHAASPWKSGSFVKVNCAAIPGTLLETELFGCEKGAFTGAVQRKPGRIESANGGTLFLDEIGEVDCALQAKLLQFLQDGTYSKIGSDGEQQADARIISCTGKRLEDEIDAGRFRSDLFYRINVVRIELPKLRDRCEDIPVLAEYLRAQYAKQFGIEREPLSTQLISYLQSFHWPGNIRELSNTMARYVLIGEDGLATFEAKGKRLVSTSISATARSTLSLKQIAKDAIMEKERSLILETLRANRWNRRKTAQKLRISYRALIYKIRETGIGGRKSGGPTQEAGLDSLAME